MKRWYLLFIFVCLAAQAQAAGLDGRFTLVWQDVHNVFSEGEIAQGFVRMNRGFTVNETATAILDLNTSVSGPIDLRGSGRIQLTNDLVLDSCVTFSNGGNIVGHGNSIILGGDLTLSISTPIYICGDTIINGCGKTLTLDEHSQIFVAHNKTLTLCNLVLKNTKNCPTNPCIRLASNCSKLALSNVNLSMANDLQVRRGQIYIHNDVIFSGTSALVYTSPEASFVAPCSKLTFEPCTTFSFAPTTTCDGHKNFVLQDKTSAIGFNGCTLKTTLTGMQLTKGKLFIENQNVFDSNSSVSFDSISTLTSTSFGDSGTARLHAVDISPCGRYVAIGGENPGSGAGGFANTDELKIYSFDGALLTALTSQDYGFSIESIAWSPDGKVLAIGGQFPTNGAGGFADTNELRLYSFDGAVLTPLTSQDYGSIIETVEWSPDGKVLAVGGQTPGMVGGFTNTDELRLYRFDGTSLTPLASQPYGNRINSVSWSPDGKFIAIGGVGPGMVGGFANNDDIRVYSFDGASLTALTSQEYGTEVYSVAWSPDGKVLSTGGNGPTNGVGGFSDTNELRLYGFNGTSLAALTSRDYGFIVLSQAWSNDGTVLAIAGRVPTSSGGFANTDELRIYNFDGAVLNPVDSKDYGNTIDEVIWSPDGNTLFIAGNTPTNPAGGFSNSDELRMYSSNFVNPAGSQLFSRSIVFGDSAAGANEDLEVHMLGGAHLTVNGILHDDSA